MKYDFLPLSFNRTALSEFPISLNEVDGSCFWPRYETQKDTIYKLKRDEDPTSISISNRRRHNI